MSDKPEDADEDRELPERFLEPPTVYIGNQIVHDPYERKQEHADLFSRLIGEAQIRQSRKTKE